MDKDRVEGSAKEIIFARLPCPPGFLRRTRGLVLGDGRRRRQSPRGWQSIGDWEGIGSLECVSVGFLFAENEQTKTLIPHFAYVNDDANRQGSGQTMHRHTAVLIRS